MTKRATRILVLCLSLALVGYAVFVLTPWPSVMLIRYAFSQDAARRNTALAKHLPSGIREQLDLRYGRDDSAKLDIFLPAASPAAGSKPLVVWIHGGAFVAGGKEDVAPYLKILAGRGYATVGVGYRNAPSARYPEPILQINDALAFLRANADKLGIDPRRIVLAGDSAGAQLATQLAVAITSPVYADALGLKPAITADEMRGMVLFCGVYDATSLDLTGRLGNILRTVMWSYFGTQDLSTDHRLTEFSVHRHLTEAFPPSFISVGNADPLAPQSVMLAEAIRARGVAVETLFFPADHKPPLSHEYQFDLDDAAGREALDRVTIFLAELNGIAG